MTGGSEHHESAARRSWTRRLIILVPYAWLMVFFLLPFLIVLKISLSQTALAQPPYIPVLDSDAGFAGFKAFIMAHSLDSYRTILADTIYLSSYLKSVEIATAATVMLLMIGFPIAYGMARAPHSLRPLLMMAVILPFWTAFLIRIYAWINILQHEGLLNKILIASGIINEPLTWLATDTAIYIGIVYSYLPFMVLPIYSTLEKMDETLLEAAADLGCPRWKAFWLVTLPLSLPGMLAGVFLCFIPIVGEFVIPDLLGGSETMMIGQMMWSEFFANRDWPVASALAITMLCVLLIPILAYQHMQTKALEERC